MYRPIRCNCLVWALVMLVRRGGYLALRKSAWGWWPHVLWSPDLDSWYAWVPHSHSKHLIPPLWFGGFVEMNDLRFRCH